MPRARLDIDLAQVERLAATGASLEAIARVLGVCPATLHARKRESSEFREAVEKGRAQAEAAYANALREIALKKRPDGSYEYETKHRIKALTFFLERRPGWQKPEGADAGAEAGAVPTIKVKIEQSRARAEAAVTMEDRKSVV